MTTRSATHHELLEMVRSLGITPSRHGTPDERIGRVLCHFGLEVVSHQQRSTLPLGIHGWSGRRIHWLALHPEANSNAMHEIAHWLIAPKTRRNLPNYGLGASPDEQRPSQLPATLERAARDREELRASALGILLEYAYGLDWRTSICTHCWTGDDSRCTHHLQEHGSQSVDLGCPGCARPLKQRMREAVQLARKRLPA